MLARLALVVSIACPRDEAAPRFEWLARAVHTALLDLIGAPIVGVIAYFFLPSFAGLRHLMARQILVVLFALRFAAHSALARRSRRGDEAEGPSGRLKVQRRTVGPICPLGSRPHPEVALHRRASKVAPASPASARPRILQAASRLLSARAEGDVRSRHGNPYRLMNSPLRRSFIAWRISALSVHDDRPVPGDRLA